MVDFLLGFSILLRYIHQICKIEIILWHYRLQTTFLFLGPLLLLPGISWFVDSRAQLLTRHGYVIAFIPNGLTLHLGVHSHILKKCVLITQKRTLFHLLPWNSIDILYQPLWYLLKAIIWTRLLLLFHLAGRTLFIIDGGIRFVIPIHMLPPNSASCVLLEHISSVTLRFHHFLICLLIHQWPISWLSRFAIVVPFMGSTNWRQWLYVVHLLISPGLLRSFNLHWIIWVFFIFSALPYCFWHIVYMLWFLLFAIVHLILVDSVVFIGWVPELTTFLVEAITLLAILRLLGPITFGLSQYWFNILCKVPGINRANSILVEGIFSAQTFLFHSFQPLIPLF